MNKISHSLICLLSLYLLIGCSNNIHYTSTQVTSSVKMLVADNLKKTEIKEIEYACFYEDTLSDFMFMLVDESKDTMRAYGMKYDLETYYKKTSETLYKAMDGGFIARAYHDTINNYPSTVCTIKGKVKDAKLVYKLTVIETQNHFYQVIFAMAENGESYFRDVCKTMLESFKEE